MTIRSRVDWFYAYLVIYCAIQTDMAFRLTEGVDSHDPVLFSYTYTSRFGVSPDIYFSISTLALILCLVLVYRKKGLSRSYIGSVAVIITIILSFPSLTFETIGPIWPWLFPRIAASAIYGVTASENEFARSLEGFAVEALETEYQEHLRILGYLIQAATVAFASGGLAFIVYSMFQSSPAWCTTATCGPWITGSLYTLIVLAWGVYGVFLLRYRLAMIQVKERMMLLRSERANSTEQSGSKRRLRKRRSNSSRLGSRSNDLNS